MHEARGLDVLPWYGFKPMVKHLRVFGSVCYALVPKEKRKKLESRSVQCTLIGYSNEKKGYRLLSDGEFIVSRDVIFDETKSLSVEEVEKQLSHLEEKVTKEQIRMPHLNKTRNEQWSDFTSEVQDDEHVEDTLNSSQVNLDVSNQVNIEKKKPKWATKLLQDVKSDEKGKTGTRSSNMGS